MSSTIFFFLFIPLLAFILLCINLIFAPHNPYMEKNSVFECGFSSFLGQNRTQFSISFFIFALLFLLFDLEILLVYPYLVSAYTNGIYGLTVLLLFLLALTLGFAFEMGKNALSIDSRQVSNSSISKPSYISRITNQISYLNKKYYSTAKNNNNYKSKVKLYFYFYFLEKPARIKSWVFFAYIVLQVIDIYTGLGVFGTIYAADGADATDWAEYSDEDLNSEWHETWRLQEECVDLADKWLTEAERLESVDVNDVNAKTSRTVFDELIKQSQEHEDTAEKIYKIIDKRRNNN